MSVNGDLQADLMAFVQSTI